MESSLIQLVNGALLRDGSEYCSLFNSLQKSLRSFNVDVCHGRRAFLAIKYDHPKLVFMVFVWFQRVVWSSRFIKVE